MNLLSSRNTDTLEGYLYFHMFMLNSQNFMGWWKPKWRDVLKISNKFKIPPSWVDKTITKLMKECLKWDEPVESWNEGL